MDAHEEVAVLPVEDVPRAVATFRDVLGFEVLENLGWMATVGERGGPKVLLIAQDAALGALEGDEPDVIQVA